MKRTTTFRSICSLLLLLFTLGFSTVSIAQFPGCPAINAGPDQTLPCSTPCTNLTATPFATGATTTYSVSSIPHTPPIAYNQAGGTAVSVGTDDVWSNPISLPFNFCYYGTNYTTINVGSNGTIQFGGGTAGGSFNPWSFTASCPSTALSAAGDVFGVYHDIDPSYGGTVKWYLLGTAPCRIFAVSFNNLPHFSGSCNTSQFSTTMMVLYETTNVIDIYVQEKDICTGWNGGRAIIGIQNPAGTAGIAAPGRNAGANWTVSTPEGWRFTPTGTPNYSVAWFQGATQIGTGNTINVCPTGTTTYTSVVTYNRCDGTTVTANDAVTVNFSNLTPPTVTPTAESCANYNNGSVIINNPAGAGPYTVNISGPTTGSVVEANTAGATANFTNLPDGNYSYTVTGANGCTTSGTFTIAPGPVCCSVTAAGSNVACNGATTGSATATPTGLAPFSYSWTGGQTSQTASNLGAGSYTVTMTDNSGCVATANVVITQPTVLSGTLTPVNVTCNGACNGTITVAASGGTPAYQYSINGGPFQASNTFTGLCNGTYAVTIKDANNCTIILNQNITQPAVLNLTQSAIAPATCGANNGSVTVAPAGGTAPYTYTIDGGASQASATFNGLTAGTHTIVVTDSKGCTKNLSITITSSNSPVASIQSQNNVSCFGGVNGSVIIGVAGGSSPFTYSLNGGPAQASNTFTNLTAGTYTGTVTDANGCSGTVTITITSPPQLTFTTTATAASCNGVCDGQIQVTASGGTAPYQYSSNNGITYALANPMTGLCAGIINVVVKDANGCLTNSDVTITQPAPVSATFVKTDPICNGACDGTITVTASGGTPLYQYSLNGGALQPGNTITGACGGNNTILIQDAHGCQFTSVQNLVDPPGFGIDTTVVVESNCGFNNGEITVVANGTNGPFTYSMDGGPFQSNGTWTNLYGGAYEITAVDALGCSESVFFGINDVEMQGIVLIQTDANCFGVPDGTIEVTNVSGALPISYELDNTPPSQFSGFFPSLAFGSHVVTISDAGNCVFTIPFVTDEPAEIQFDTDLTNISCNGGNTGEIEFINVSGGTGAHQYSIDNGATFQSGTTFTGLAAGTYQLAVTDVNGCMVNATVTLTQAPALAMATTIFDLACFNDASGGIQIGATGGTGAYQYSIDNGTTFSPIESFFNLDAGTYDLITQDAAGCQITGTATVNEPAQLAATYTPTNAQCFDACDGEIVVAAAGGTAPYVYSPDNGLNYYVSPTLQGLCAGNVDLQVKDDNGCFITAVQVIGQPSQVTLNAVPTDETCAASNGQIVITGSGGTGAYTYSIDNGATYSGTSTYTGLPAGAYDVFIQDANNCLASTSVSISNQASPIIIGAAVQNVTCNAACDGQLQVTVSGGTGAISYSIGTPQAASLITNICAGTYTLTITDANGCTDTDPVTVTEPSPLTAIVTPTALTCFNNNTGEITFNASGGTAPYSYSTNNGASFSTQTNVQFLSAGTYNTVVQDANGCLVNTNIIVTEPAQLVVQNIATNDASCFGVCDGDATATIAGGTAPYSYSWSNGATGSNTTNGLCAASYSLTVTDDNSCTAVQSFNITEPPLLVITSTSATDALCDGDCNGTITINSNLATGYSVDNGATFQPSNTFNGLCANTYTIQIQDAAGCTQSGTITVGQPQPLVQGTIPEDGLLICYDGYGTLSGSATGGTAPYYFVWNTGDTTQYLNVNLTAPATFTCTVYDQNGCVSNAQSADVTVRPPFVASVTTPVSACPGQPVIMTGSGVDGLPGYTYEWLTPTTHDTLSTGTSYTYTPNGSETVLMVAHDECYRYDTLPVTVQVYALPSPEFVVGPASGCSPFTPTFSFPAGTSGLITSAQWTFGDGATGTGTTVSHQYIPVGCYDVSVQITTAEGCVTDTTMQNVVCVVPDPIADFTWSPVQPTTINSTVHFYDNSENAATYEWDFGAYGTSTLEDPTVNYGDIEAGSQQVCLMVTSPEGCRNEVCKPIIFVEEFLIFVPNTFTPDGDEFNNIFKPVIPPGMVLDDYTFKVYNRWGEVMFESHDVEFGWDGTYHEVPVKEGVYTWTIVAKGGGDKKSREAEGHVNMLR